MDTFHISHFTFQWNHKNVNANSEKKNSILNINLNRSVQQFLQAFHGRAFSQIADSYKLSAKWKKN